MIKNAFLHVHDDGLPILKIAEIFSGVRVDFEPGMSQTEMKALVSHYQHDNLLEVKAITHDVDTALWAGKFWPRMDIQFLIEPDLTAMDWSPPRDYLARLQYLVANGVRVCGPSFSVAKNLDVVRSWTPFSKIAVHGYGYEPEELPYLVHEVRKYTTKPVYVAEYTRDGDHGGALWDEKERASYHARAIKSCPVPIVIYRAQHLPSHPGYFEFVKGEWVPRPAWGYLRELLASAD